jgi:hypothetical protein
VKGGRTTTTKVEKDVRLTPDEQAGWDELMARHADEFRGEMARALTDDARPGWEGVEAKRYAGPEPTGLDMTKWAMARALFDDVRPDWEEASSR